MSLLARAMTLVTLLPRDVTIEDGTLTASEVRRGLKLSIFEGMFAQVHISLTLGAFLTGFALLLGAGNITLGIVAALPFLTQPLQLLGAWLIERQGVRKPLAVASTFGRTLWLGLILLPYVPLAVTQRLALLVVILFVAHALLAMCSNAWTNWMTDLVPPRLRGRYFSTRSTAMAAVAMAVNYGAGVWLDYMRNAGQSTHGYTTLFGLAVLCAGVSTVLLSRQPEPRLQQTARMPLKQVMSVPLRHREFRRFMFVTVGWSFGMGVSAPFFGAHALTVLRLPFTTLATIDVIIAMISLFTLPIWGRLTDRLSHRTILLMCMLFVVPLPWFWVLATPTAVYFLYANAVFSGIWWPGLNLAQANRLMEQVPREARGSYLALFGATTGLAFFVASFLGGGVANLLANVQWSLGPLTINNYETLFIASSLIRLATVVLGRKAL